MPQIQIIPAAPGFGEQLGQALGGGLSQGISASLNHMLEQKKQANLLKSLGIVKDEEANSEAPTQAAGTEKEIPAPAASKKQSSQRLNLTPENIVAASLKNPKLGSTLSNIYLAQRSEENKLAQYEREKADKFLEKLSGEKRALSTRKIAIDSAISAIKSGISPTKNWLADVLNLPMLRDVPAAQLNTSAKTNLLASLEDTPGARPNQFLEQQIARAFPAAGQSKEANLAQAQIIKAKYDIDEYFNKLADDVAAKYEEAGLPVPGNLERMILRQTEEYNKQRMKELAYDLQSFTEEERGPKELLKIKPVAAGTPLTVEKAKILLDKVNGDEEKAQQLAINLGYEIPPPEIYSRVK